jgi:hypothetical protein
MAAMRARANAVHLSEQALTMNPETLVHYYAVASIAALAATVALTFAMAAWRS